MALCWKRRSSARANCMLLRTALLVAALGAGRVAGDAPFDVADFIKAGDGASAPVASALVCAHPPCACMQRLLVRRGSHHPRVCTVASFLGLHAPRPLALPVILNVLMIGFSGESGLNVSEARLRPWFEQLQSQLPHAVMPAEAAASERPPPVPSAIEYRYHTRLHVLPPEVPAPTDPNPN